MEISGRVAVITGGSNGIGRATAECFIRHGGRVVVADVDETAGKKTVQQLNAEAPGMAVFSRCNVCKSEDIAAALRKAVEWFGRLDVLVNNAGIGERDNNWKLVLDVDLKAVIDGTLQAVEIMKKNGGGVVVNIGSMGGIIPMPDQPTYGAAKAGVVHFTRSLASLYNFDRVRVVAVCPSFTDTQLVRGMGEQVMEAMGKMVGGIMSPEFVAEGVCKLVKDDAEGGGAVMRVTVRNGHDFWRGVPSMPKLPRAKL